MQVRNQRYEASLVVRVSGRLDAVTAPAFEAHCQQVLQQGERDLILEFGGMDYLSSAGLRSILVVAKATGAAGGQFALANAGGMVRNIFEISGFLRMFRVIETLELPAA